MGVEYSTTAVYTCDQTGETVTATGDLAGAPEGWLNMGALWFRDWAALRDYATARAQEATA